MKTLQKIKSYMLYINLFLLVTGIIGIVFFISQVYQSSKTEALTVVDEEEVYSQNQEEIESQYIDIQGQINNPGVYEIKRGDTLYDVIIRSDGFTKSADMRYVQLCMNQAKKLVDEQKIYIPASIESYNCDSTNNTSQISTSEKSVNLVSINSGSKDQLMTLKGVGESTAEKIIEGRPYERLEDLMEVKGIGESTFEKIESDITL